MGTPRPPGRRVAVLHHALTPFLCAALPLDLLGLPVVSGLAVVPLSAPLFICEERTLAPVDAA